MPYKNISPSAVAHEAAQIRVSGLFDPEYYRSHFSIDWNNKDCVEHFCTTWRKHLISPCRQFDICKYLGANPDVALSGVNPLLHYINEGKYRGFKKWAVDENFYKADIYGSLAIRGGNLTNIAIRHKRVAIFAGYSKNFIVEDYVIWYLEGLKEVCDAIIFITDNYLPIHELNKINHLISYYDCRKKRGIDHGAWSCGLKVAREYNIIPKCNELVLCNDSMYGPVSSLAALFDKMKGVNCDFWGLTNAHGGHEHIQSFFLVLRDNILLTSLVDDFLEKVSYLESRHEVIKNGEHKFTETLLENGFKYAVFSDFIKKYNTGLRHDIMDDPARYPSDFLKDGIPFVKKKNFTHYKTYNHYGINSILAILKKISPALRNLIAKDFSSCLLDNCDARFSLIMRTYNRAHKICNAIESLLKQTYQNFELIIVDDGSTDNTEEIIRSRYGALLFNGKFVYHRHATNMGISQGSNTGIGLARNEWIGHLDTDNNLRPNFLEQFAIAIRQNPERKTFIARFKKIFSGQEGGGEFSLEHMKFGNYIDVGVFIFHKSLFHKLGGFDIKLKTVNDYDIIVRYCMRYHPHYIDSVLLDYCDDTTDRLSNVIPFEREKRRVWYNNFGLPSVLSILDIGEEGIFDKPLLSALLGQTGQFYHNIALVNSAGANLSFYKEYLASLNKSLSTLVTIVTPEELRFLCDSGPYDYVFMVLDKKIIPQPCTVMHSVNEASSFESFSVGYPQLSACGHPEAVWSYHGCSSQLKNMHRKGYICVPLRAIDINVMTCFRENNTGHRIQRRKRWCYRGSMKSRLK